MSQLTGTTALVTGGARGIGRGIVERLAADGAFVVFGYLNREDAAAETVARVRQRNGRALAVRADLTRPVEIEHLFVEAEKAGSGLNHFVNNAGTMLRSKIAETTEEQFDAIMSLNVKAAFFAHQQAARRLLDGGRIVNISSTATVLAQPNQAAYSMSKAALDQLTRVAAKELAGRGITVNTVAPGAVETDELRADIQPAALERWRRASAFGRLGQPDDIADVVGFLLSEDARWITGQNIRAAGGAA
ncbi:SDR family oxidoreductase [Streptomyces sp. NPDC060184]|uniref:SDR family oxidoreductase n=1 Tax=Streptomyces sp. NPDC060184 TaxID=3347064 RepID=UPI0036641C72